MNLDSLGERFGMEVATAWDAGGDLSLTVHRDLLIPLMRFLKEDEAWDCNLLVDLCGVDYLPMTPRFGVVYHLCSLRHGRRLRVKVALPEDDPVADSCVSLWPGADWMERECHDLFGIVFRGHPDLRRILLPPDFVGHPLRKDFPLEGLAG
ncbi:MAG: NADH-quinone oxidoreductase subunit C [Pseudomonadota bacterium]|nr:NADH-quinone oxidoreductase subunit C [Pseudomonadota bacterium]